LRSKCTRARADRRAHAEPARADGEARAPRSAQALQRVAQAPREVNVRRPETWLALRLERLERRGQPRVDGLVVAEGFEEQLVRVNGDDRVERAQPLLVAHPAEIAEDDVVQRKQELPQQDRLLHPPPKCDRRAARVHGKIQRHAFERGQEGRVVVVSESDFHKKARELRELRELSSFESLKFLQFLAGVAARGRNSP